MGEYRPAAGDRVLVLQGAEGAWIVGVLGSLRLARPPAPRLEVSDGVTAALDGDRLLVSSPRGTVLFTHDARTGKSEVRADALRVQAGRGDLELSSARRVRIEGKKVELRAGDEALSLDATTGARLATRLLRVVAEEGRATIKQAIFAAETVESAAKRTRLYADVVERRAGRLVERVKDAFREVEGVSQTRAGRIRTVAKGAFQLLSDRATIRAEKDLALLGEKISLA